MAYRQRNYVSGTGPRAVPPPAPRQSGNVAVTVCTMLLLAGMAVAALSPSAERKVSQIEGVPIVGWQLLDYRPDAGDVACVRAYKALGTPTEFAIAGRVFFEPPSGIEHLVADCPHYRRSVRVVAKPGTPNAIPIMYAVDLARAAHGIDAKAAETAALSCVRRLRDEPQGVRSGRMTVGCSRTDGALAVSITVDK